MRGPRVGPTASSELVAAPNWPDAGIDRSEYGLRKVHVRRVARYVCVCWRRSRRPRARLDLTRGATERLGDRESIGCYTSQGSLSPLLILSLFCF